MIKKPPKLDLKLESRLGLPLAKIIIFCQHWHISELEAFGSILREDFRPDSDIDLPIQFTPQAPQGLLTLALNQTLFWRSQVPPTEQSFTQKASRNLLC